MMSARQAKGVSVDSVCCLTGQHALILWVQNSIMKASQIGLTHCSCNLHEFSNSTKSEIDNKSFNQVIDLLHLHGYKVNFSTFFDEKLMIDAIEIDWISAV